MATKIVRLFDWRGSQSAAAAMILMLAAWVLRVFLFGAAYQLTICHEYSAGVMVPVLAAFVVGLCTGSLALRKTAAFLMAVLWIMVAVPTALIGVWQPVYFGFAFCFAWLYVTAGKLISTKDATI